MNEEIKKKIEEEAQKEYTVFMISSGCSDCGLGDYGEEDANEELREAFIEGAEYRDSLGKETDAVEFVRFVLSIEGTNLLNSGNSLQMCYELFKQSKQN